jgi:hypothetical protein
MPQQPAAEKPATAHDVESSENENIDKTTT